ncbi:class I SAM-dependent methyltransferase [Roseibium sp.]|uniref:class I SAM-dependent methyltransferase n=1 Tax=Roseibium sp. TaxID=1936156 RepID=UPI003A97C60E
MSGFSADWLALREPFDLAARSDAVEQTFIAALPSPDKATLLDLASGAGSTVAALSGKLPSRQTWILTDNDPGLLGHARARFGQPGSGIARLECVETDLSRELEQLDFDGVDGVTTSAFLDLVTEDFIEGLVKKLVASGKPFLASLSYDGRAVCDPMDRLDDTIRQAMNRHQQTDKGFGAALGPFAWSRAAELLKQAGYRVTVAASDWVAGPDSNSFQKELLAGWLEAAAEMGIDQLELERWRERRLAEIEGNALKLEVGHQDLCAIPA